VELKFNPINQPKILFTKMFYQVKMGECLLFWDGKKGKFKAYLVTIIRFIRGWSGQLIEVVA
jgi:hypothetical protein